MNLIRQRIPNMNRVAEYLKLSENAGRLSNFGPVSCLFAERLSSAAFLQPDRRLITTCSGHAALVTAYAILDVRRLVVPAFTFESTRAAAVTQGIETVIVDVDPATGCITPDILANVPDGDYDAVVAVCALSTIPDLDALSSFCRSKGKRLIIDGAATWGTPGGWGKPGLANYGDAYCYSFHATKTLPTGEGGALVVGAADYERAVAYTNFGRSPDRRVVIETGHVTNAKMSEFAAAVGLVTLEDIDRELLARFANAALYRHHLGPMIPPSWSSGTVYSVMPTFAPTTEAAGAMRDALSQAGYPHLAYYAPIESRPVADSLYARSICLPVHSEVGPDDIERICATMKTSIKAKEQPCPS